MRHWCEHCRATNCTRIDDAKLCRHMLVVVTCMWHVCFASLAGSYYCLNMIMITLSTFLAVIVINLYFRGDRKGPVPPRIRTVSDALVIAVICFYQGNVFWQIFLEGMGRLLLIRQNIPLPDERKLTRAIIGDANFRTGGGRERLRKVHLPELKYNKFQMNDVTSDGRVSNMWAMCYIYIYTCIHQ